MTHEEKMGDMLNSIGQHLADILDTHPNDSFLYAEVTEGSVGSGVFHDVGDRVIYFDPSNELVDALGKLWDMAPETEKWAVLQYEVKDGKFDARYTYPEDLKPDEWETDQRQRVLIERYGDKPVIYPEPDERFHALTEADLAHLDETDS
jgi:hypothetical protein